MRSLIFGTRRFDRSSIPCELADLSQWPGVDDSALDGDDKKRIKQRVLAITLFVEGTVSLREIGRQTGVRVNDLYRLLGRCIACHEDGRIYGFRALLPWLHIEGYERRAPVPASGKGSASGAFRQLLNRYPNIDRWIRRKVAGRSKPMTRLEEVPRQIWRLHAGFLAECRKAGIKANEYPFNQVHLGERSLASYVRKLQHQKFNDAAAATGAQQITHPWNDDPKYVRKPATYPYQVVEFDGHKIDVRLTLRVDDPFGFETLMLLGRIWILVLIDVASRAVIGYTLVPGREYTRDDVAQALQAALMPHVLRQTKIPALKVRAGGGFPSEVIPQTAWACWDTFRFDAAKSHLANATLDRLTTMIGCATDNGPLGEKNERAFIERFFDQLASHFAHRLPASTGSDVHSVERALCDVGKDISLMITLDELEDVIDVVLANYNGEPHTGLGGRTPLEAMQFLLDKGEGLLRSLPVSQRSTLCLLQEAAVVPVCGNVRRSVRPHVNFAYSRYSSRLLSGMTGLIGQKLRIYYNVKDIRNVRAFLMNGEELGTLTAARPWCLTPHSLRTRQEIHKLIRQGKLRVREGEDPVGAWFAWKQKQARTHSADAASLARALSDRAMAHSALANPSEAVDVPLAAHSSNVPTTTVSSGSGFPAPVLTKIFTY